MCYSQQQAQGDTGASAGGLAVDPRDMSGKYNTALSPEDEASYQKWAKSSGHENDTYDYDMRGAWKAGAGQNENGHFTDQFKKPNHPTFSNESQYHGVDGNEGGAWGKKGDAYTFRPGKTSAYSRAELQDYFKRAEPGNSVLFDDGPKSLTIPTKADSGAK